MESSSMKIIVANIGKIHTEYRSNHRSCSIKISQIVLGKAYVGVVFTGEIFENFKNAYFGKHLSVNHYF